MYILGVIRIIHNSDFDWNSLFFGFQINNIVEKMGTMTIYVTHELFQSILSMEDFHARLPLFISTQVGQCNLDTCIQISKLTHTTSNDIPLIMDGCKDCLIWPKLLTRTTLVCGAHHFNWIQRFTLFILLLIYLAITEHLRKHMRRKCIHTTHTYTMKTTTDLVRAFIEFTAGVKNRHNNFEC